MDWMSAANGTHILAVVQGATLWIITSFSCISLHNDEGTIHHMEVQTISHHTYITWRYRRSVITHTSHGVITQHLAKLSNICLVIVTIDWRNVEELRRAAFSHVILWICQYMLNSLLKFELSILYGYTTRRDNHDDAKWKVLARASGQITRLTYCLTRHVQSGYKLQSRKTRNSFFRALKLKII